MVRALSSLLFGALAVQAASTSSAPSSSATPASIIPTNAPDGMYMVTFDDELVYLGPHDKTELIADIVARNLASLADSDIGHSDNSSNSAHTVNKFANEGVFCDDFAKGPIPRSDVVFSHAFMASWFHYNKCFQSKSITCVIGNSTAFACNYGNETCTTMEAYVSDVGNIDKKCGGVWGGSYKHGNPNLNAFGRTPTGDPYC